MLTVFVTNFWQLFVLRLLTGIALGGARAGGVLPASGAGPGWAVHVCRGSMRRVPPCTHAAVPQPPAMLQARCPWYSACWETCTTRRRAQASPPLCSSARAWAWRLAREWPALWAPPSAGAGPLSSCRCPLCWVRAGGAGASGALGAGQARGARGAAAHSLAATHLACPATPCPLPPCRRAPLPSCSLLCHAVLLPRAGARRHRGRAAGAVCGAARPVCVRGAADVAQGAPPAAHPHKRAGHQPGPVRLPALVGAGRGARAQGGDCGEGAQRCPQARARAALPSARADPASCCASPPTHPPCTTPPQGHDPHLPQRLPVPEQGDDGAGRHAGALARLLACLPAGAARAAGFA